MGANTFHIFSISLAVDNERKIVVIETCSLKLLNKNIKGLDHTLLLLS